MLTPFGFNEVLECLKIAFFFALGYSLGAFVCFELFNWLVERKDFEG
ncbi:hypothetical protein [Campylobacter upsaliensis]|uniref:Uncharacterized protein n=1 Tax=Campylobacter upsaliensis TaxID=28080 RepID=A0A381EJ62_CAMUP|nr:hypothetical protein [Campylobacter upsaliensis]SUX27048.1 Uncharacterised protein [Campylobacter upsaliensis]